MAWTNKVMRVNLTEGKITEEPLNQEWVNQYLGQRGLATKYLVEEIAPTCDALGPDNKFIVTTGPLPYLPPIFSIPPSSSFRV